MTPDYFRLVVKLAAAFAGDYGPAIRRLVCSTGWKLDVSRCDPIRLPLKRRHERWIAKTAVLSLRMFLTYQRGLESEVCALIVGAVLRPVGTTDSLLRKWKQPPRQDGHFR